jgi:hypothetical protein
MVPEHLEEWWGYGAFFLVLAVAILWLVTRTTEIPFLGPHAGESRGSGCWISPARSRRSGSWLC